MERFIAIHLGEVHVEESHIRLKITDNRDGLEKFSNLENERYYHIAKLFYFFYPENGIYSSNALN